MKILILQDFLRSGGTERQCVLLANAFSAAGHGVTLVTFIGLDVDGQARVRRTDGSTIDGLYAAGEVIGATATTGKSFCSGMLITPSVVHARLCAARLAAGQR